MLCILSALLGCQGMGEYRNMLYAALKSGIDPAAIKETVYQATAYLGIGRVYDFLVATNQIMEKCGVKLPLAPQGTTDRENRFQAGLDKQIALFGPGMEKQQTEAPVLRRNINRWLADNCFGDYYTRTGLNDQERELKRFMKKRVSKESPVLYDGEKIILVQKTAVTGTSALVTAVFFISCAGHTKGERKFCRIDIRLTGHSFPKAVWYSIIDSAIS